MGVIASSSTPPSSIPTYTIDLSYKTHLNGTRISQLLEHQYQYFIRRKDNDNNNNHHDDDNDKYCQPSQIVEIDVSSSNLQSRGFTEVVNVLIPLPTNTSHDLNNITTIQSSNPSNTNDNESHVEPNKSNTIPSTSSSPSTAAFISISLDARMNQLRAKDVSFLFQRIIQQRQKEQQQQQSSLNQVDSNQTTTTTTIDTLSFNNTFTIINNITNDTQIEMQSNSTNKEYIQHLSPQSSSSYIYMDTIDIGMNGLTIHDTTQDGTYADTSQDSTAATVTSSGSGSSSSSTSSSSINTFYKERQAFLSSLRQLIEMDGGDDSYHNDDENSHSGILQNGGYNGGVGCPCTIRMDRCGLELLDCQYIGKGILNNANTAHEKLEKRKRTADTTTTDSNPTDQPTFITTTTRKDRYLKHLYLSGNPNIGDAGVAALAAAIKVAPRRPISSLSLQSATNTSTANTQPEQVNEEDTNDSTTSQEVLPTLETLDVSSCQVGDAGAASLAIALRGNVGCIQCINLGHNCITDQGAIMLGRVLSSNIGGSDAPTFTSGNSIMSLDLSNNHDIGDNSLTLLGEAVACGALRCLSLRSCNVRYNGSAAIGKSLVQLIHNYAKHVKSSLNKDANAEITIRVDLSGNSIGVKEIKKKAGSLGKASARTASYMNFFGKRIKKGLKDTGVSDMMGGLMSRSTEEESDEEDENYDEDDEEEEEDVDDDALLLSSSDKKCGATALAESIIESITDSNVKSIGKIKGLRIIIGMRRCNLDRKGGDALAAAICLLREKCGVHLQVDTSMNSDIEIDDAKAIYGDDRYIDSLEIMTQRYHDLKELQRRARERKEEAAKRRDMESELSGLMDGDNSEDDFGFPGGDYYDEYDN